MRPLLRECAVTITLDESECYEYERMLRFKHGEPVTAAMVERHIRAGMVDDAMDRLAAARQIVRRLARDHKTEVKKA